MIDIGQYAKFLYNSPDGAWSEYTALITPDKAKSILSNNPNNRNIRTDVVTRYLKAMQDGSWDVHHPQNKIVIGSDGMLRDGQHRLTAIMRFGRPVQAHIVVVAKGHDYVFDRLRSRTLPDALRIGGMEKDVTHASILSGLQLILTMGTDRQRSATVLSDASMERLIIVNAEMLEKIREIGKHGKRNNRYLCNAMGTAALIAQYMNGVPYETLVRFSDVVNSGVPNDLSESAAAVIREDYINWTSRTGKKKTTVQKICMNTVAAISDFAEGKSRYKAYQSKDDSLIRKCAMELMGSVAESREVSLRA